MAEVTAHGLRFHVQRLGPDPTPDVPVAVFLHGLVMDNLSSWYFAAAAAVSTRAHAVLYDLRGHGFSERPPTGYALGDMIGDLEGVLDALDLRRPVALVGNSYGGLLALAFAVAHPERVADLCLVDAHLNDDAWGDAMAATLGLQGEERDRRIAESFAGWAGRHSERKRNRLAGTAHALVHGTTLVQDLRTSHALTDADLRALDVPILALYGERSDILDHGRRLATHAPRCELRVLPGCTHSVLWEATEAVRDALLGRLAGP